MEAKLQSFIDLVLEENQKHNLVSRKAGIEELWQHVEDSRKILSWISPSELRIVDIGSGAGFPGLVLAICCPDCQFTLVESDLKKSGFLALAGKELHLSNVEVIRERAETLGQDPHFRQQFDVCSSRAVAAMRIVLEYGLPLVKVGGTVWLWKGSNYQYEIYEAQAALKQLGGAVESIHRYSLVGEQDRAIVIVGKSGVTPAIYPRKVGVPPKRPL